MNLKTIILAWWSWTRLWPISRKFYPKQFIKLEELDNISLFQKTITRALLISKKEDIIIVTNADYKFHCLTQSSEIGVDLSENQILVETQAKNTLPAIAFALSKLEDNDNCMILSSDHIIENEDIFVQTIEKSIPKAKDSIITFGIKPFCPHTGYGYIEAENSWDYPYKVKNFKEKPDLKTVEDFIEKWYFWNSWMFLFSRWFFWQELKKYAGEIANEFESKKEIKEIFANVPDLSIDYWILEKSDSIYLSPLPIYWNDLGSFEAIDDYLASNWYKNINNIEIESKNNFILSEVKNKKVVLIGVENLVVVDTRDALLISKKWETSKLREVVKILKEEASELANFGVTVYRPWWSYTIIDEGVGFKSKRITVLPWKKLSLQMHYHRSEHWVVVSGTAEVTIWEEILVVRKWESVFIPAWEKHRLDNKWKTILHLIESQIGDYLEEDDIVRFDDDFGRK